MNGGEDAPFPVIRPRLADAQLRALPRRAAQHVQTYSNWPISPRLLLQHHLEHVHLETCAPVPSSVTYAYFLKSPFPLRAPSPSSAVTFPNDANRVSRSFWEMLGVRPEMWRRFVIGMSIGEDEMEEVGIRSTSTSMAESKRKKFVVKSARAIPRCTKFRTTKLFVLSSPALTLPLSLAVACCLSRWTHQLQVSEMTSTYPAVSRTSYRTTANHDWSIRDATFPHPQIETKQTRHAAPSTQEYESSIPRIADYVEMLLSRRRAEEGSRRARNARMAMAIKRDVTLEQDGDDEELSVLERGRKIRWRSSRR